MNNLLATMMAVGGVAALPVRGNWPIHRALIWLSSECSRHGLTTPVTVTTKPDPDVCVAVDGLDDALDALIADGFLVLVGAGYTARWLIEPGLAVCARRDLLRTDPSTAKLVAQAGQRLASWASTALKNADTAAASWTSTVCGTMPTVRQPELVLLK